jgi:hypothetical protein
MSPYVRRLQIAVDDAAAVSHLERVDQLPGERDRVGGGDRAARDTVGQRLAIHVLQHDAEDAAAFFDVVDRRDVRVIQRGEDAGFRFEAGAPIGSAASAAGRTLIATSRCRRLSRAR